MATAVAEKLFCFDLSGYGGKSFGFLCEILSRVWRFLIIFVLFLTKKASFLQSTPKYRRKTEKSGDKQEKNFLKFLPSHFESRCLNLIDLNV